MIATGPNIRQEVNMSKNPPETADSVHLLFAADHRILPGLLVAIGSALDFRDANRSATVHVLDAGLSPSDRETIRRFVSSRRNASALIHPVDFSPLKNCKEYWNGGLAPYARLLLDKAIPRELRPRKILYFDADMLVSADVCKLYDTSLDGNVAAMCRDGFFKDLSGDCPFAGQDAVSGFPYFNSGTLLLDVSAWSDERLGEKAVQLALDFPDKLRFWDQTILNYLLRGRIKELDRSWNYRGPHCVLADDVVYHYASGYKPWNVKAYRQTDDLWWLYYKCRVASFLPIQYEWWKKAPLVVAVFRLLKIVPSGLLEKARRHFPRSIAGKTANKMLAFRLWRYGKGDLADMHRSIERFSRRLETLPSVNRPR